MDVQDIAKQVFSVLETGRQIAPFSNANPDLSLDEAYQVTAAVRALREAQGEIPIGRKIGFALVPPHPGVSEQSLENAGLVASNCLTASHSVKPPFQHPKQGRTQACGCSDKDGTDNG